jgi:hypothetical protein
MISQIRTDHLEICQREIVCAPITIHDHDNEYTPWTAVSLTICLLLTTARKDEVVIHVIVIVTPEEGVCTLHGLHDRDSRLRDDQPMPDPDPDKNEASQANRRTHQ